MLQTDIVNQIIHRELGNTAVECLALCYRNRIEQLPLKDSFAAIKIHFGEPGNLAYLRPNYAARMATLLRSLGAKPFLTDCNTLYSGRRANAVDHLQSAMENGFNPISAQCQVIIGDGLKGTDYREIPLNGEYCPAPKIGTAIADADLQLLNVVGIHLSCLNIHLVALGMDVLNQLICARTMTFNLPRHF